MKKYHTVISNFNLTESIKESPFKDRFSTEAHRARLISLLTTLEI